VHPLRAEPVAWLSARGTILGGLLSILAVLAYLAGWERGRAEERVSRPWLAAVAALFVASVLARATSLVLPAVLLLLDAYPLRRIPDPPAGGWLGPGTRRVLREKLGLVALGALGIPMGFLARSTQPKDFWRVEYDPLVAGAWSVYSGAFYVWKTLCPWNLGPIYVMPSRGDFGGAGVALAASTVAGISLVVIAARRRWPAALAAWIAYAVILAPVSGVVPFGRLLGVVDRYSYAACIGWAIAAGGAVALAWEAWGRGRLPRWRATLTVAVITGVLLGWSVLSWRQVQVWRDAGRLWAHAVAVSPACVRCHVNLANWFAAEGRGEEALAHYGRGLALDPGLIELHTNIGLALVRLGRPAEAVPHYERVLARHPEGLPVRVSLAVALVAAGRLPEAVARLEEAAPFSSPDRLVDHFRQLTTAQPAAPIPRLGLLQAYARVGDRVGTNEAYEALARLHPALALASQAHATGSGASLRP
jgi:tetratricopeptide (TPR) repeat protein